MPITNLAQNGEYVGHTHDNVVDIIVSLISLLFLRGACLLRYFYTFGSVAKCKSLALGKDNKERGAKSVRKDRGRNINGVLVRTCAIF